MATATTLHITDFARSTNPNASDDRPKVPQMIIGAETPDGHASTTSEPQYRISRAPDTRSLTTEYLFTARMSDGTEFICQAKDWRSAYLEEAMSDLLGVKEEAEEEGWTVPDDATIAKAERVFGDMFSYAPRPYAIYAMPDGEIAIDAHSPQGTKVVVVCDAKGGARCLTYLNGDFDSREHEDARALPDDFVRDALRKTEIHQ